MNLRELRARAHPRFTVWDLITVLTASFVVLAVWAIALEGRRDIPHPALPVTQAEATR